MFVVIDGSIMAGLSVLAGVGVPAAIGCMDGVPVGRFAAGGGVTAEPVTVLFAGAAGAPAAAALGAAFGVTVGEVGAAGVPAGCPASLLHASSQPAAAQKQKIRWCVRTMLASIHCL